jgi:hypothetical protein
MKIDLDRVDGPHSPERTAAAANLIPDAVRYLNHASLPANHAPGISYAGDVDTVLGAIQAAGGRLQQTLSQLAECLRDDLATGRLRLAHQAPTDDPDVAVATACTELERARGVCAVLEGKLRLVRSFTAWMYLDVDDDEQNKGAP